MPRSISLTDCSPQSDFKFIYYKGPLDTILDPVSGNRLDGNLLR